MCGASSREPELTYCEYLILKLFRIPFCVAVSTGFQAQSQPDTTTSLPQPSMTPRLYVTSHHLYSGFRMSTQDGVVRRQFQAAQPLQAPTHDPVQIFRDVSGVSPLKLNPAIAHHPRGQVMAGARLYHLLKALRAWKAKTGQLYGKA